MPIDQAAVTQFAKLALQYGPKMWAIFKKDAVSNSELLNKIAEIDQKLDRMAMRNMLSAFEIINQVDDLGNDRTANRLLTNAEMNFLQYIGLDPSEETAGKPNRYWICRAFFGLSVVAMKLGEDEASIRWLLKAFIVNPRETRENLATDIYDESFASHMEDFYKEYVEKAKGLPEAEQKRAAIRMQQGAVIIGWGISHVFDFVPGASIFSPYARHAAEKRFGRLMNDDNVLDSEAKLNEQLQKSIDGKCTELATQMLVMSK